jgi:hypothetical protein
VLCFAEWTFPGKERIFKKHSGLFLENCGRELPLIKLKHVTRIMYPWMIAKLLSFVCFKQILMHTASYLYFVCVLVLSLPNATIDVYPCFLLLWTSIPAILTITITSRLPPSSFQIRVTHFSKQRLVFVTLVYTYIKTHRDNISPQYDWNDNESTKMLACSIHSLFKLLHCFSYLEWVYSKCLPLYYICE